MMIANRLIRLIVIVGIVIQARSISAQVDKKDSFEVRVVVENLGVPSKLILTVREISQWTEYKADSRNGKFSISGTLREPSFAFLVLKYGGEADQGPRLGNIMELFIEKGITSITAKDSLRFAVVKGGPMQRELETLNQSIKILKPEQVAERDFRLRHFVEEHPDSYVSLYALQNFSASGSFAIDPDQISPLFKTLSPRIRNTLSGKELNKDITIAQRTTIGSVAPDFIQKDTLERDVKLSSFRGQYVLIDFWASWCRPCRMENPILVKTYQEYKDKNFTIVSVSLDHNKASWLKAIRKDQLTWTHTSDLKFWKNGVALLYGVKTVPQNVLLDPEGKIVGKNIPAAELANWLKERARE
jgi:thiol-disulfide isomerase/thioredoxin